MTTVSAVLKFVHRACLALSILGGSCLAGAELSLQLQYPMQMNQVVLTGIEREDLVFRPAGRDTGGRAYLAIDELQAQRAVLNFLFPKEFYDAIEDLESGRASAALPTLRTHAQPLLEYAALAALPGNMLPAIEAYVEALCLNKRYDEALDACIRLPLAKAPASTLGWVGDLNLELQAVGKTELAERLHRRILAQGDFSDAHFEYMLSLADGWRAGADYLKAFQIYRAIQLRESPVQVKARLWVAYCSFYLGQDIVPLVFLETLPEMTPETPGYSLRELIVARMSLKQGDRDKAMRSAVLGKTYSDVGDPWYPETLYFVGQLYAERGMDDASLAVYRELAIMFPESEWAAKINESTEEPEL